MILRELFYFDKETLEPIEDKKYDPYDEFTVKKKKKTIHVKQDLLQDNPTKHVEPFNTPRRGTEKGTTFCKTNVRTCILPKHSGVNKCPTAFVVGNGTRRRLPDLHS